MCGLSGYITTQEYSREAQEHFKRILINAEVRGTDACGISFVVEKGRFYYAKAPKPASEFANEKVYKKLIEEFNPTILIGHNRQATQGDKTDNMNNHPVITKTGLSLIHNGILRNEEDITKLFDLKLDAEVDSEVIVKLIEYYIYAKKMSTIKAIQLTAKHIYGSMAIALLHDKEPKTLYLLASENPINLAYHIPTGTIYFASTEGILKDGLIEYDHYFRKLFYRARSKEEYVFKELEDNTGLKITNRSWKYFSVERPKTAYEFSSSRSGVESNYGGSRYTDEDEENEFAKSLGKTYPYYKSLKPVIVEAKGKEAIIHALKDASKFDITQKIQKPSEFMSELLLYRLEYTQESFTTGDYLIYEDMEGGVGRTKLHDETRRIIDTLQTRLKKTKRLDLYIPRVDEVWLIDNKKYKKFFKKGKYDPDKFRGIEWVLTDMNPKAYENLLEAEKYRDEEIGKIEEDEEEEFDIITHVPSDYWCARCKDVVPSNICINCGSINLPKFDDRFPPDYDSTLQNRLLPD